MFYFFLLLTALVIASQTVHTYYVFDSFSKLSGKLRTIQAVIFCSILSLAILAFVLVSNSKLALLGAIVEIIINMYYYAIDYWENGFKAFSGDKNEVKLKRRRSVLIFWRKNWVAMFFGVLLPLLIYIFSEQMMML